MNDKNNVAVVNTTDITHIINELRILDTRILNRLSSADGVIVQLNETITRLSSKNNLNKALIQKEERIKIDAEYAQKEISENLRCLEKIWGNLQNFEKTNEKMIQEQTQKVEIFKNALELRYDNLSYQFLQELKVATESLLTDVSTKVEEIKKEIDKKLKAIDLKKFEKANQNVEDIIINFNVLHKKIEEVSFKNNIFTKILSFVGGATVMALVFFFLK